MDGSRELKSKFHGLWELKQTFHESHKIQCLILFVTHRVLQNWGVNYLNYAYTRKLFSCPKILNLHRAPDLQ